MMTINKQVVNMKKYNSVLVVDDFKPTAWTIMRQLQNDGYDAEMCTSPESAINMVLNSDKKYDLIILDLILNGINGPELSRKFKGKSDIIFITGALDGTSVIKEATKEGWPVILKDFDPKSFVESITKNKVTDFAKKQVKKEEAFKE